MTKLVSKDSIRKTLIKGRKSLSGDEISQKSSKIFKNLLKIDAIATKKRVLLYLPINNEVETAEILAYFKNMGAEIYLPGYFDGQWLCLKFVQETDLIAGPFGTLQPKYGDTIEGGLDLAIIPAVGFSKSLIRLGYGNGVYDRLLSDSRALMVGLAYDFQIVDYLPAKPHDLRMNFVVTNSGVLAKS